MTENVKKYVGWALVIALIMVAWSAWSASGAYQDSVHLSSGRTISVTSDAKVVAVPDVATFSAGIITQGGKDLAALQKENTTKSNKIIEFLKSKGVDEKDIQTEQYNLEPRYQTSNCYSRPLTVTGIQTCPPAEIVGYTINQLISVKVRKFETIGDLLAGAVTAGANTVSNISFTIDEPDALQNQAREKAIEKAKLKAQAIARAGGFSLGKVVSFDEGYGGYPVSYAKTFDSMRLEVAASQAPAPTIEAGSQDVTATVTIRYEIR